MNSLQPTIESLLNPIQRIPITPLTFPLSQIHNVPLIYMAYLTTRSNTQRLRLMILPILLVTLAYTGFSYRWEYTGLDSLNWLFALGSFLSAAKGIEYACVPDSNRYRKLSESRDEKDSNTPDSWLTIVCTGLEVFFAFRGIGWTFGLDTHIPYDPRPLGDKPAFVRQSLYDYLSKLITYDLLSSMLELVPNLRAGGSIYLPALSPLPRFALATLIHATIGAILLQSMEMAQSGMAVIAVGVFGQEPFLWPPLMDHPWASCSVTELWSRRWHQVMRRMFLYIGGYPGQYVAGRVGLVMGCFAVSAYWHEFGFYMLGRGWDNTVVYFFLLQGVFVLLEGLFKRITGRRVGGWPGRIWLYFDMILLAQPMVDCVARRGALKSLAVPWVISPTKRIILPFVFRMIGSSEIMGLKLDLSCLNENHL